MRDAFSWRVVCSHTLSKHESVLQTGRLHNLGPLPFHKKSPALFTLCSLQEHRTTLLEQQTNQIFRPVVNAPGSPVFCLGHQTPRVSDSLRNIAVTADQLGGLKLLLCQCIVNHFLCHRWDNEPIIVAQALHMRKKENDNLSAAVNLLHPFITLKNTHI